ncbi:MAG TPA: LacI family DNA-binding transcriptional regulator [Terriglobales bacterium]
MLALLVLTEARTRTGRAAARQRLGEGRNGVVMSASRIRIREIAKLANVSIGTVDRALHGRRGISEETRRKVLQIAKDLGYAPNLAARALSVGGSMVRIGVCIPREIHFFYDQLRSGILAESARFAALGVEVLYHPVGRLGEGEEAAVEQLLENNIQALVITPGDPQRLSPLIEKAERKDIRVICVASDAPGAARSSAVCVDPRVSGSLAAELMSRFASARSRVAVITGMKATEDHRTKVLFFSQQFSKFCAGGKVVKVIEGHEDEDETFQKCFELLGELKGLRGLYVTTANCLPVCRAIGARGLSGKIVLVTTDLFKEMVPYFKKGTIAASIYQQPYVQGQTAVRLLVDHILRGRAIPETYYLSPAIVMRSNLHLFREVRHLDGQER